MKSNYLLSSDVVNLIIINCEYFYNQLLDCFEIAHNNH